MQRLIRKKGNKILQHPSVLGRERVRAHENTNREFEEEWERKVPVDRRPEVKCYAAVLLGASEIRSRSNSDAS